MEQFEVYILGCGSALPTTRHNPSSQIVRVGNELFMIDCGEGTQLQIRKSHQHFSRINNIFISHLHGDHCFGLIGLISTFGLLGRRHPLHIYAHPMMRSLLMPQIEYFCQGMQYEVILHDINPKEAAVIYEDNNVTVETLPLNHRIPCCGFLISEKPKKRHLRGEIAEYYNIPTYARQRIREGEDYTTPEGETIPNERLTTPPDASRRYVYCSDTTPAPTGLIEKIRGVDLLYHEATFAESEKGRAAATFHSTAQQAATVALEAEAKKLVLGHFSSRYDDETPLLAQAQEIFPATILAKEGLTIKI
ncbi:MAG: ribonuclease Z [Bacteroidaceae bacterium]|nr:ribonuclease Z [Bacteroidaceae bacterium]